MRVHKKKQQLRGATRDKRLVSDPAGGGHNLAGFSSPQNTRLNTTAGSKLRVTLASLAHQTKHPRTNSGTASAKKCQLFAALAQNLSHHHALTRAPLPPRRTSGRSTVHTLVPSPLLQNVAQHVTDECRKQADDAVIRALPRPVLGLRGLDAATDSYAATAPSWRAVASAPGRWASHGSRGRGCSAAIRPCPRGS